ncbi:hypothetical protein KS419_00155, partial [Bacillus tamaricis]
RKSSRICFELPRRTGRPNIGHATGRGVLPDGRIRILEKLEEEEAVTFACDQGACAFLMKILFRMENF